MGNHKWKDHECVKCGLKREMRPYKLLMAIVNHPPWNMYKYGQSYVYWFGLGKILNERPQCKPLTPKSANKNKEIK